MHCRCSVFWYALLVIITSAPVLVAQRREANSSIRYRCELEAPLTTLEDFDRRMQTIIVRGSTQITPALTVRNSSARVDAVELRDESHRSTATGVVITLRDGNREDATRPPDESRSFIDYEEIDRVIKAWDQVARTDDTITKLNNFESRYRSKGDFEINVFRQTPGGTIAAAVSAGLCLRVTIFLSLDELVKLRHMVAQAKERLDELR